MPSDYRLKYIEGQIANASDSINIDDTISTGLLSQSNAPVFPLNSRARPDGAMGLGLSGTNIVSATNSYNSTLEPFEGGVHINNARTMFVTFAAIIIILYIIES